MGKVVFEYNEGSLRSPGLVGAAFFVEHTGHPASNSTGDIEAVSIPGGSPSQSSSSSPPSSSQSGAVVQATSSSVVVGEARDIFCFSNSPYECEGYFGQASLELGGIVRCSPCEGDAFTGMGTSGGVPTPAPVEVDDDDGLSQMGQERAQGGTSSSIGGNFGVCVCALCLTIPYSLMAGSTASCSCSGKGEACFFV